MEFKRCVRCGCFFTTDGEVCNNCTPKDKLDMYKVKNYFEDNVDNSIDAISINTGVSTKNISRFLNNQDFINFNV